MAGQKTRPTLVNLNWPETVPVSLGSIRFAPTALEGLGQIGITLTARSHQSGGISDRFNHSRKLSLLSEQADRSNFPAYPTGRRNSAGKSSFLSIIRSLAGLATDSQIPDFKEEPFDLGSFDEIVFNGGTKKSRPIWFKAGCRLKLPRSRRSAENSNSTTFDFKFESLGTAPYPVRRRIYDGEYWIEDEFNYGARRSIELGCPRGVWRREFNPTSVEPFEREFNRLPFAFFLMSAPDRIPSNETEVKYKPVGDSPHLSTVMKSVADG